MFEFSFSPPPSPPPSPHVRLRVPESQQEALLLLQALAVPLLLKLISDTFHACSLNPLMFSRAKPCALKPLSSMLMFSDWLVNLLINPLVCAQQHCPLWNAIRGKRSHDRMTCCQLGFQSQWQYVLKWLLGWYRLQLISVRNPEKILKKEKVVDLVIKTSATLCNINEMEEIKGWTSEMQWPEVSLH